jgi:hypothetical protein
VVTVHYQFNSKAGMLRETTPQRLARILLQELVAEANEEKRRGCLRDIEGSDRCDSEDRQHRLDEDASFTDAGGFARGRKQSVETETRDSGATDVSEERVLAAGMPTESFFVYIVLVMSTNVPKL